MTTEAEGRSTAIAQIRAILKEFGLTPEDLVKKKGARPEPAPDRTVRAEV